MEDIIKIIKKAKEGKWTSLDLSKQELNEFPVEVCTLMQLKFLNLYKNHINEFPPEIAKLTNLENLNLGTNNTYTFPNNLTKIKSLKHLDLLGSIPRKR